MAHRSFSRFFPRVFSFTRFSSRLCAALLLAALLCTALPTASLADSPLFCAEEADALIQEAKEQIAKGDRTPLFPAMRYRILWIGYTHVTYNSLDFRMTDSDRQYLKAVTQNFEKYVETTTEKSLDIIIDLYFVDTPTALTKVDGDDWLLLARDTVSKDIERYFSSSLFGYDTVITTVQTDGSANVSRNSGKPGYGVNYVMLGVKTHGLENDLGYSTFNLGEPAPGTYPLRDPAVPSLYATAVAVHEWLHQLEYLGEMLGVEFPPTHAYQGPANFPGYREYINGKNNYDFCEFYGLVLQGRVPYTGAGRTQYVGMYPKMWKLTRRTALNFGPYEIRNGRGQYLAMQAGSRQLTLSDRPFRWVLRYAGDSAVIISPISQPALRLDLDNAWDSEGNTVKLYPWSGAEDAQRWLLSENSDGSFCIRTFYSSHRAFRLARAGDTPTIQSVSAGNPDDAQRWFFTQVK